MAPADAPQPPRLTGTCRSLFGRVDHTELRRELCSRLREAAERDSRRWNFNFGEDKPLDGAFVWEESPAADSPSFYRERPAPAEADARSRRAGPGKDTPSRRLTDTRMTDFYGKRRKTPTGTKNDSEISAERVIGQWREEAGSLTSQSLTHVT